MGAILLPTVVLLVLGTAMGMILGIADKFLKVEIDERIEQLIKMLPGYNCGACGHPGCAGLANAVFEYGGKLKDCTPLKGEQDIAIREYLKTAEGADGSVLDVGRI